MTWDLRVAQGRTLARTLANSTIWLSFVRPLAGLF